MVRNFLVCNFSYLEIVDILQIKKHVSIMPIPPPHPLSYMKVWIGHCVLIIIGCSRTQGGNMCVLRKPD